MDKNKCPKLKFQKNFPQKISYIDTTHGGPFFATFFKISRISLHYELLFYNNSKFIQNLNNLY